MSQNPADYNRCREHIAELLTQNGGEYVFRIGQQLSHKNLFSGELNDETQDWSGTAQTIEDIDTLRVRISNLVEEVGGKVECFKIFKPLTFLTLIN